MALRLLELTGPSEDLAGVSDVIADVPIVDLWHSGEATPVGLVRILVEAKHSEALSDALVHHFGERDNFRIILLTVEATLPALPPPPEPADAPADDTVQPMMGLRRISREELYEDLSQASQLTRVYVITVALSTLVAAVGLIRGDVAIIIGAMVIAPLLGPNVALSLAATLGHVDLAKRSLRAIGVGVAVAAGLSALIGTFLTVDPSAPELAARTRANVGDVVLALSAGAAGSLAFTTGVPAVVVGVMVAVALLPPLVTAGLLAGSGHPALAWGALVLTLTNVTCVNLAAIGTFLLQKVRPRTWWEAKQAQRATRLAVATWVILLAVLLLLIRFGQIDPV